MESSELLTTNRKALTINLDQAKYGRSLRSRAGQELLRHFFQAGGSRSGHGRKVDLCLRHEIQCMKSTARPQDYVSRERLGSCWTTSTNLLWERLPGCARGSHRVLCFFRHPSLPKSSRARNEAHGWMGVRFESHAQFAAKRHHSPRQNVG